MAEGEESKKRRRWSMDCEYDIFVVMFGNDGRSVKMDEASGRDLRGCCWKMPMRRGIRAGGSFWVQWLMEDLEMAMSWRRER